MVYIGVLGFALLFLYDINQISIKSRVLKLCFALGILLIVFSTVMAIMHPIKNLLGIIIAVIAFVYTVYALFFALDFNNTYVDEHFEVCDSGLYGLCRHPGFYGLLGVYVGLYIGYQTEEIMIMMIVYNLLNFLYIVFEDRVVFMKTFNNYGAYKKEVPFLIPDRKSISRFKK